MNVSTREGQQGAASLWFLVWAALLMMATATAVTFARVEGAASVDVRQALESAAKTAATRAVTAQSQANGDPRLDPHVVHDEFVAELARNLGLEPGTLLPLPGSGIESVQYVLLVYNGEAKYGLTAGRRFTVSGTGPPLVDELTGTGFPATFDVSATGIVPGPGTGIRVELPEPGVIAMVTVKLAPVIGREEDQVLRWVSARVHKH